jgi:Golgi nucleoside diphosphatase
MIDAGSSGSRVQIYVWSPHSGDPRQLLNIRFLKDTNNGRDVFQKITPGLSSCAANPSSASDYLDPLIAFAAKSIPEHKHSETKLYILATAGMRLLDPVSREAILNDLRTDIPKKYKFLVEKDNVQVISGKDEGIYSWISLNYMKHKFDHRMTPQKPVVINLENRKMMTRERTIGMIEMGGASVQIAFEINDKHDLEEIRRRQDAKSLDDLKDVLIELNLGCTSHDEDHTYLLYVRTFLGLGANVAHQSHVKRLLQPAIPTSSLSSSSSINSTSSSTTAAAPVIMDPCLNRGNKLKNQIANSMNQTTEVQFEGAGNFEVCRTKLQSLLLPTLEQGRHCSVNESNCPLTALSTTRVAFENTEFYGFSEFYFSLNDVLGMGGKYDYNKAKEAVEKYCSDDWSVISSRYQNKLYPRADQDRMTRQCFKSTWVMTFLHDGLHMPRTFTDFTTVYEIDGNAVQWTLGALLYKTRFLPLHSMSSPNSMIPVPSAYSSPVAQLIFFVCMAAVLSAILFYMKHLNRITQPVISSSQFRIEVEPLLEVAVQ